MLTILIIPNIYPSYFIDGKQVSYKHAKSMNYKNVYSHLIFLTHEFFNFKINTL